MIPFNHKLPALEVVESKIYTRETLLKPMIMWRFFGKKLVFTNGCFDIIHRGHIDYLAKASDLGDAMVVAINSDASVKRQGKGVSRPLQDEKTRAMILASLHFVSAVIIFDEDTPKDLIEFIKPDVLVKGADYNADEKDPSSKKYIVGSDLVRSNGGEVKTLEYLSGFSTTSIEQKIKGS
ncbi:MAG: D-beta-D-heptose 1-phosphate adenylyltransferase [Bacteroidetes bacterium]|jgi:rfaE bifunctional protein nucleotidyltransferase chain/domain|nr:D-beta-D-heptose 1-phosphate adenylyltransferase [Bacteroidota bacterium]